MNYLAQKAEQCPGKVFPTGKQTFSQVHAMREENGQVSDPQPFPGPCSAEVLVKTWINSNIEQDPQRPLPGLMVSDRQAGRNPQKPLERWCFDREGAAVSQGTQEGCSLSLLLSQFPCL